MHMLIVICNFYCNDAHCKNMKNERNKITAFLTIMSSFYKSTKVIHITNSYHPAVLHSDIQN